MVSISSAAWACLRLLSSEARDFTCCWSFWSIAEDEWDREGDLDLDLEGDLDLNLDLDPLEGLPDLDLLGLLDLDLLECDLDLEWCLLDKVLRLIDCSRMPAASLPNFGAPFVEDFFAWGNQQKRPFPHCGCSVSHRASRLL